MHRAEEWLCIVAVLMIAASASSVVECARVRSEETEDTQQGARDSGPISQRRMEGGDSGRGAGGEANIQPELDEDFDSDEVQMGCTELRSKRYISDGYCTSLKPVTEVVCAGECLPLHDLPWYAEFLKYWSKSKLKEWRCVNDVVRRKRVHLQCENGERRTYRIRAVRSCKCKKYNKKHNESDPGKTIRQSPPLELEEK